MCSWMHGGVMFDSWRCENCGVDLSEWKMALLDDIGKKSGT